MDRHKVDCQANPGPVVAIIGGGISGLAAAYELLDQNPNGRVSGLDVVVVESSNRLGGKILTSDFGGRNVDEAADAYLARGKHVTKLVNELGLGDDLVAPSSGQAWLWTAGGLKPLPQGLLLGVPSRLGPLWKSKLLSKSSIIRASLDLVLPGSVLRSDEAVGRVVSRRLGRGIYELLVDPLVSGINAGRSDELSIEATTPALAQAAHQNRSLMRGVRSQLSAGSQFPRNAHTSRSASSDVALSSEPVFWGLKGGMGTLPDALHTALSKAGARFELGRQATSLSHLEGRWVIETNSGALQADAVIVATPAHVTADLLKRVAPSVSTRLSSIEHASVTMVTLAYHSSAIDSVRPGSGFLVPRRDGHLITACSWSTNKWPHLARAGELLVRASVGRIDDSSASLLDDKSLVDRVHSELKTAMGLTSGPMMSRISRWPAAFPQYAVGHLQRVAEIEAALSHLPSIFLAGAAYRGVGIPACIRSGQSAAKSFLRELRFPSHKSQQL